MENPITKFAPFLVGEFPKPFQELLDKVTSNEPLTEDDLKKVGKLELSPKFEGRQMTMVIQPI